VYRNCTGSAARHNFAAGCIVTNSPSLLKIGDREKETGGKDIGEHTRHGGKETEKQTKRKRQRSESVGKRQRGRDKGEET
jgi:hypothetical protein